MDDVVRCIDHDIVPSSIVCFAELTSRESGRSSVFIVHVELIFKIRCPAIVQKLAIFFGEYLDLLIFGCSRLGRRSDLELLLLNADGCKL